MSTIDQILAGEDDSKQEAVADHPELKASLVLWHEDEEIIYNDDFSELDEENNNHGHDHAHGHSHGHGGNCTMDHGHDLSNAGSHAHVPDGHDHGHSHGHDGHSTTDIQRQAEEEMRKLAVAEEREREARRAVEVQRKIVEEAQQRAADNLKQSTTNNQRLPGEAMNHRVTEAQSLMTKNREKSRRETVEDVIREQAIWV